MEGYAFFLTIIRYMHYFLTTKIIDVTVFGNIGVTVGFRKNRRVCSQRKSMPRLEATTSDFVGGN